MRSGEKGKRGKEEDKRDHQGMIQKEVLQTIGMKSCSFNQEDKLVTLLFKQSKFYDPFLWIGFNCHKAADPLRGDITFKVACRVQIWKKTFCRNSDKFGYSFIKNYIMFMHMLCIYKKTIILSLFKIDTFNFTMYILTILTCPLKIYVIGLHNL